jgi:hypothetical protein
MVQEWLISIIIIHLRTMVLNTATTVPVLEVLTSIMVEVEHLEVVTTHVEMVEAAVLLELLATVVLALDSTTVPTVHLLEAAVAQLL